MSNLANKLAVPLASKLAVAISGSLNGYTDIIGADGMLAPFVTFTRSSNGSRYNSAGLLEMVAANSPRYDYDPATVTRANLFTYSEFQSGVTDAPVRGGLLTATSFSGLYANTGLQFGHDGVTGTYAYKGGAPISTTCTISVFVQMDDGNPPSFGSGSGSDVTNTFYLVIAAGATNPLTYNVQSLGNGLYRVSATAVSGTNAPNSGVVKYATNDNRTFKVSGYQLEVGSTANGYIPTGPFERGPELIANGDFSGGLTGWTAEAGFTVSGGVATTTVDTSKTLYQTNSNIIAGKTYRVTYTASGVTVNAVRINVKSPGDNFQTGYINLNGTVTQIFTATASGAFGLFCFSTGVTIDNISVKEINDDYASPRGNATLRGLLIEEQRTNILLRSQEFENAAWVPTSASVTANATTAPDGTNTADALIASASGGRTIQTVTAGATASHTFSCYIKKGDDSLQTLLLRNGTTAINIASITFNLDTGIVQATTSGTGSITAVGNGWYRCSISSSGGVTAGNSIIGYVYAGNSASVSKTVYIWGAQLEAGAFATSYIPTTTASVTRAADNASVTSLSSIGYNASEGALIASFSCLSFFAGGGRVFSLYGSGFASRLADLYALAPGNVSYYKTSDAQQFQIGTGLTANIFGKIALAYKADDYNGALNGTLGGADTATSGLAAADTLGVGNWNSTAHLNGHIRRLRYYPKRLSNAQLQALTA